VAFARVGEPDPQYVEPGGPSQAASERAEPRDEIDELFTGASASRP
jgi:hypothetical protein